MPRPIESFDFSELTLKLDRRRALAATDEERSQTTEKGKRRWCPNGKKKSTKNAPASETNDPDVVSEETELSCSNSQILKEHSVETNIEMSDKEEPSLPLVTDEGTKYHHEAGEDLLKETSAIRDQGSLSQQSSYATLPNIIVDPKNYIVEEGTSDSTDEETSVSSNSEVASLGKSNARKDGMSTIGSPNTQNQAEKDKFEHSKTTVMEPLPTELPPVPGATANNNGDDNNSWASIDDYYKVLSQTNNEKEQTQETRESVSNQGFRREESESLSDKPSEVGNPETDEVEIGRQRSERTAFSLDSEDTDHADIWVDIMLHEEPTFWHDVGYDEAIRNYQNQTSDDVQTGPPPPKGRRLAVAGKDFQSRGPLAVLMLIPCALIIYFVIKRVYRKTR